jgi:lambda repressor-like predicted transcriptional regulator
VPRKTFTEEQIVAALKKAESGVSVADVCRQTGVTEMTVNTGRKIPKSSVENSPVLQSILRMAALSSGVLRP